MANIIPLIDYLQMSPRDIPVGEVAPGPNTTNAAYSHDDINHVGAWPNFNVGAILQRYGNLLQRTQIQSDPFPASPPQQIVSETQLRARMSHLIDRVRRALRAGFNDLAVNNELNGLTTVSIDSGTAARIIAGFRPDVAYYAVALPNGHGPNRAPGDVKPSWKWGTALRTGTPYQQTEFCQVLSQVNWYMKQHGSRYGWVLTNLELVAIRRLDDQGNLEISAPISWEARGGVAGQPRLTMLLALWYIGMLAAQDQGEGRWNM